MCSVKACFANYHPLVYFCVHLGERNKSNLTLLQQLDLILQKSSAKVVLDNIPILKYNVIEYNFL